jgi:hypothetical protein
MKDRGIKSKLAMFNILDACHSKTFSVTFETAARRWLKEKEILQEVHERAMVSNPDRVKQDTYFALHTLHYLVYGRFAWSSEPYKTLDATCPYGVDAKNFILTLVTTNTCLCLCYTNYVVAAADEFGHTFVTKCIIPGHVYIAITYDEDRRTERDMDCDFKLYSKFRTRTDYTGETNVCALVKRRTYLHDRIYATLDAGFVNNWFIDVTTDDPNFKEHFSPDMVWRRLNVKIVETVACSSELGYRNFVRNMWNDIHSFVNRIMVRQTTSRLPQDVHMMSVIWGHDFSVLGKTEVHPTTEFYMQVTRMIERIGKEENDPATAYQIYQIARIRKGLPAISITPEEVTNMTALYASYDPGFSFPKWTMDRFAHRYEQLAPLVRVFCVNNADRKLALNLATLREPVNIGMTQHFDAASFRNKFGWSKSMYRAFYNEKKELAPNIAVYTPTQLEKGTTVHILNLVGYAFDSVAQPDYQHFSKDWLLLRPAYARVFRMMFDAADHLKKPTLVVSLVGASAFAELYPGGKESLLADVWLPAFTQAYASSGWQGSEKRVYGMGTGKALDKLDITTVWMDM